MGAKGTTNMNKADFTAIKELQKLNIPPRVITQITKRSHTVVSVVSRCDTWQDYEKNKAKLVAERHRELEQQELQVPPETDVVPETTTTAPDKFWTIKSVIANVVNYDKENIAWVYEYVGLGTDNYLYRYDKLNHVWRKI